MYYQFPFSTYAGFLSRQKLFILLESGSCDPHNHFSYLFTNPVALVQCTTPKTMACCIAMLQQARNSGYYLSGFFSYEAGAAFLEKIPRKPHYDFPLLWMGIFRKPFIFDHRKNRFCGATPGGCVPAAIMPQYHYRISTPRLTLSKQRYCSDIRKIQQHIAAGDTYQVNHTMKYLFRFQGSPIAFYRDLLHKQPVRYGAMVRSPAFTILSFSPELFFRQCGRTISVQPMKGTAPRGRTIEEDTQAGKNLRNDPKNKAENIMIVDLLRNDLGKISQTGSVTVTDLFRVEQHPTLLQMTSTIQSRLKNALSLWELFSSLFPSGSVTGAPKISTARIIDHLEREPRRIYTGAIGFFSPQRTAVFNVAIRTILLRKKNGEMGVGSGITSSSSAEREYEECVLKSRFLTTAPFQLIETMRWDPLKGIALFASHYKRLRHSADFFKFPFSRQALLRSLSTITKPLSRQSAYKIRLLLCAEGTINGKAETLPPQAARNGVVTLSRHRTNSSDIFLFHKTTNRVLYNSEYRRYSAQGFFDVLFRNERDEITEGAISTLIIQQGSYFFTPPVSCGLLPGVYRAYLKKNWKGKLREKIIRLQDLENASGIYCVNSVRGISPVRLHRP